MKVVNQEIVKVDAMALLTGKPVYTEDMMPKNCLVVKVLRSPHPYAKVIDVNTSIALKVPGIECAFTYKDVPQTRFTFAGQAFPEPSPYDRLILDQYVRYVGDPVAIVAGDNEKAVDRALKMIKVKYEILEPVLDFEKAIDNPSIVHPEEDYALNFQMGNEVKRNICSAGNFESGDLEAAFAACDEIIEEEYHTKANAQAMMETFKTYTYLDYQNRLNVVSSTQIPFHLRHILSKALEISKNKVRVIKPRIGGGFGAKQTAVCEVFPAFVTMKTGKPARIIYTRQETFSASNSRHEMKIKVKLGSDKEGNIKAIQMYTLSNAGAYGEHSSTTVGLSAHKTMPLYGNAEAYRFDYDVVYTNTMGAGAFRGYGATQGCFALESTVNQLATKLGIDPVELRLKNIPKEGDKMAAYYGEQLASTGLKECLEKGKEMIGWESKYPCKHISDTKVRSVGVAMTMQGSALADLDVSAVEVKLNDDGFYTLMIGATDMGTGCDTVLSQMAAETLECDMSKILVHGVDTDVSPFDPGSYASRTTYLTGMAVIKTCEALRDKMMKAAAHQLEVDVEELTFDGTKFENVDSSKVITLDLLAQRQVVGGSCEYLKASVSHTSHTSPPPFMAGFVEIELDKQTGQLEIIDYVGVVDCGTVINKNLARIQAEGGIAQGIGMALYEDVQYTPNGKMMNNSFMQYKIPTRLDVGNIRVDFESSYEPTGPFGAKSIGEVVINTPSPALAHAVYNGSEVHVRTLPITAEKICMGMLAK